MIDCEHCRDGASLHLQRMIRAAVAIVALLLFGTVMLVHLFDGGDMPRLAIFALGVALVFLGDFAIYFGRAFLRWQRWRRGEFHM